MEIFRGCKTDRITQWFGENKAGINPSTGKVISSSTDGVFPSGYVSLYNYLGMHGHNGIDFASPIGEDWYFAVDADTEWYGINYVDDGGGKGLDIISRSPVFNGHRVKFRHWHLEESYVKDGDPVVFGQKIYKGGNTGWSSGPHTHKGWKLVDIKGQTIDRDNGYLGSLDWAPYFTNKYVLDEIRDRKNLTSYIEVLNGIIAVLKSFISFKSKTYVSSQQQPRA